MREAWVLGGFDPTGAEEEARFAELRRDLGFAPNVDAHLLDSNDERAKRSPKRVLRALSLDDRDREQRCWTETPLEVLRARGVSSGLHDYLVEVEQLLVPLCTQPGYTRDYLIAVLKDVGGHVTQAADRAGVERESMHRLLKRHGLRADDYRTR